MTSVHMGPTTSPGSSDTRTWVIRNLDEMAEVYAIRREVFVAEQGLTSNVHDDPDDRYSEHVLAEVNGQIAGTGRVTFYGDEAQIVWVAVRKPFRRHGVGRAVMEHLLQLSRDQGCRRVSLNAQTHALHFYESLGFEAVGRRFFMSKIEHQYMILDWSRRQEV